MPYVVFLKRVMHACSISKLSLLNKPFFKFVGLNQQLLYSLCVGQLGSSGFIRAPSWTFCQLQVRSGLDLPILVGLSHIFGGWGWSAVVCLSLILQWASSVLFIWWKQRFQEGTQGSASIWHTPLMLQCAGQSKSHRASLSSRGR